MVTEDGNPIIAQGEYTISIGGGQPDTGAPVASPANSTSTDSTRCRNNEDCAAKAGRAICEATDCINTERRIQFMANSKQSVVLTRREALLLSTTAGLGRSAEQACLRLRQREDSRTPGTGQCVNAANGDGEDAVRQGARVFGWRRVDVQRSSVWGNDGRGESMASGQAACAMGGRVSSLGIRSKLPADAASLDEHRADVSIRLGRRLAERGHAEAEHLDAQPDGKAARDARHRGGLCRRGSLNLSIVTETFRNSREARDAAGLAPKR